MSARERRNTVSYADAKHLYVKVVIVSEQNETESRCYAGFVFETTAPQYVAGVESSSSGAWRKSLTAERSLW